MEQKPKPDFEELAAEAIDGVNFYDSKDLTQTIYQVSKQMEKIWNDYCSPDGSESQDKLWDDLMQEWHDVSLNMQSPHILPYLKSKFTITRKTNSER